MQRTLPDIAGQVRSRRTSLGLTQEQLASLAGCSVRFLREVEGGKASLQLDKLLDVLEAVGLELLVRVRRTS
jgi:HTH-type transcriptional regulator/antitoxin HipB